MSFTDSLAAYQTAVTHSDLQSQIGYAVAAKQIQAQRQAGAAALELLEEAANLARTPGLGENLDLQG